MPCGIKGFRIDGGDCRALFPGNAKILAGRGVRCQRDNPRAARGLFCREVSFDALPGTAPESPGTGLKDWTHAFFRCWVFGVGARVLEGDGNEKSPVRR